MDSSGTSTAGIPRGGFEAVTFAQLESEYQAKLALITSLTAPTAVAKKPAAKKAAASSAAADGTVAAVPKKPRAPTAASLAKQSANAAISSLAARPATPLRAPPVTMNAMATVGDLTEWLEWAKSQWSGGTYKPKTKRKTPAKKRRASSTGAASGKKKPADDSTQATPSKKGHQSVMRGPPIEDSLLPNFATPGALPPLIVDFCGLPQDLVAPVLMTWDFLSWFASLAQQPVISQLFANLEDLLVALQSNEPNQLADECFACLLRIIHCATASRAQSQLAESLQRVQDAGVVVNSLTWMYYLHLFLRVRATAAAEDDFGEDRDDFVDVQRALDGLAPLPPAAAAVSMEVDEEPKLEAVDEQGDAIVKDEAMPDAEPEVKSEEAEQAPVEVQVPNGSFGVCFYQLPLERRIQVLSLLTEEAMASPIVRELMEGCVMRQVSLRSFVFKNRASKKDRKAAEAKAAQSAPAVKGKKGQKEAAESTSRAVSPAVADDAAAAAAAAAAAPKKHAFNEADIEELLARSSVRREPIGSDRYRRQYWKFAGDSRRCFVHDTVNQRWGFYDAPRMRALLTALNPRGIREFELRSEFERHEFALNHSGFTSTPFVPAASLASPPRSTVKSMAGQSGAVASASAALAQSLASATSEPSYLASTAAARAANFDSLFLAPRDDDKSADDLDAVPASDSPLDAHERELRRVLALAMDADGDDVSKDAAKDAAKEAGKDIQTTAKKALSRRELLALKVQRERLLKRKLGRVHLRAAMQVGSVSLTPESLSVDVLFGANVTASSPSPAPGAQPQSHGDHDYVRCPVCQEQVNPGEEFHCMLCHDTHGRDEMSARKWESHMTCCQMQATAATSQGLQPIAQRLAAVPASLKAVKATLLDVEAAIPMEAVRDSDDAARRNWIASVKHATEHTALRPLLRVIRDGLRSDWLRPWFDSERWAQELDDGPTVSSLAASLFYLDQAIVYTEVEHKAIAAEMARHANDDSDMEGSQEEEEDEEQPAPERIHIDGCRICFSAEDEAETLICDECEGSFHMYCLRPRVRTVPAGDWYCPECRQTQAIAKKQVKAAPPARGRPVKRKAEPVKATRGKAAKFNADEVEMPSLPSRTLSALSGPFELHASTFASVPPSGCHVCLEDDGEQALICDGCDGEYHLACLGLKAVPAGEFHCDRCIALAAHADQLVESESEQSESEAESSEAGTEVSDSEPEDEDDDEEEEDEDDD